MRINFLPVCFPVLSRKGKRPVTLKLPHAECYDLETCQKFYAPHKLGRSGLDRMIRYDVTNAEVGAPLTLPFALSNVPCSHFTIH